MSRGAGSGRVRGVHDTDRATGICYPRALLDPKLVMNSEFKYQKVFGEGKFIASGVVYIPVGGSKPGKPSRDNAYVSVGKEKEKPPKSITGANTVAGVLRYFGGRLGPSAQDDVCCGYRWPVSDTTRYVPEKRQTEVHHRSMSLDLTHMTPRPLLSDT